MWLKETLFFKFLNFILMAGSLQFFISAFNQIILSQDEDLFNSLLAYTTVIVYGIFTFNYIYIIRQKGKDFDREEIAVRYGYLTRDLRHKTNQQLAYPLIFLIKRAVIAFILVNAQSFYQMYAILAIQFVYICYLGAVQPLHKPFLGYELAAECTLLLLAYYTFLYVGYIADTNLLEIIGYSELFVCLTLISIKTFTMTVIILRQIFFTSKKVYAKIKNRKNKSPEKM